MPWVSRMPNPLGRMPTLSRQEREQREIQADWINPSLGIPDVILVIHYDAGPQVSNFNFLVRVKLASVLD